MSFDTEYARRLNRKFKEQLEEELHQLSQGQADTFENYRERVGRIAGLNLALDIVQEVDADVMNATFLEMEP